MGLIQTQPFGLMNPSPRITARNSHLIPEIYLRSKRILRKAQEEMIMANSVVRRMVELWQKMKSGTACTCRQDLEFHKDTERCEQGVPDIATFLLEGNLRLLNEKEFCPICYGTGIEGGYNLFGTVSVMLTANNPHISIGKGLSLKKGSPYTIHCAHSGKVGWIFDLPRYFTQAHTIVLYWNKVPENYNLYLNDKEFNIDIFNTLGQLPNPEKVKLVLEIEDTSGEVELYYIRLILKISRNTLVSVDLPNYTYNYTGDLNVQGERQTTVTANFDASSGEISVADLFYLDDDGTGWRVIENEVINPLDVLISNNTTCRLIRSFETEYLLPSKSALKKYPMPNYSFLY